MDKVSSSDWVLSSELLDPMNEIGGLFVHAQIISNKFHGRY